MRSAGPPTTPNAQLDGLLPLVLESAKVGAWTWVRATSEVTDIANSARLFGLEFMATLEDWLRVIHPDDCPSMAKAIARAQESGRFEAEFRVVLPDGTLRTLRGTGSLLPAADSAPARFAGVVIDITDRNRADEVRSRLAAIVDSSDDAIVSKDLNGVVTSWNAAATNLFGYLPNEIIGKSILTIIPPELQSEEPAILATLRSGKKIDHYETVRIHKNGSRLNVSLTISPLRDSTGAIVGASKIARDIGERLRMQEAIIQSEKLAATGRMAAAIAHEINNPLEAVTNLAYLVSVDSSLSDAGKRYARLLLDEIGRVSDVAKQSLGFFRDSKKPGSFDLCKLLDSIVTLYQPLLDTKGIALSRDFSGGSVAYGSAEEIRQVFANLVRNAIEAVERGGHIQIRLRTSRSGMRRILVADDGPGIPAQTKGRLFQPFVTSKGAAGNGLGLWVSRGIVRKHHGSINVRTCTLPGRSGTVFVVVLPSVSGQTAHNSIAASPADSVFQHSLAS